MRKTPLIFRAPSCPVVAASLESQSAAGGVPRRAAPRPQLLGGKNETDPLGGVGTRVLRACGRAGREGGPGRDVEVRVRDRRPEADVHTDDQEGRGQARRDDELAGPEGDETQGRETEGRRSDLLRRAGVYG